MSKENSQHHSINDIEVSVVMPCLNEEETLATCIDKAISSFKEHGINGEVVVSDNGSTDRLVEIAKSLGARVVHQAKRYLNPRSLDTRSSALSWLRHAPHLL